MSRVMNPVIHFEMPADDRNRMADFYTRAFGWKTEILGPERGHYVLVTTSECDASGRPKERGCVNGGFYNRRPGAPDQYPSLVIAVDDVDVALQRVAEAGGIVLEEPLEIPGIGKIATIHDTEGNRVSVLQPHET